MIHHLQQDYIEYFGLTGNYSVTSSRSQGSIVLNDGKACHDCKTKNVQQCDNDNEEQNFRLHSDSEISIVDIEQFFNQFNGKRAGIADKCDVMLFDDDKIAFVDMYCGQQKYIHPYTNKKGLQEGKLAKARKQITSTVDKLYEVPAIKMMMGEYAKKTGIFACRKKQPLGDGTPDETNMQVFLNAPIETGVHTLLTNGFRFVKVDYPDEYIW